MSHGVETIVAIKYLDMMDIILEKIAKTQHIFSFGSYKALEIAYFGGLMVFNNPKNILPTSFSIIGRSFSFPDLERREN